MMVMITPVLYQIPFWIIFVQILLPKIHKRYLLIYVEQSLITRNYAKIITFEDPLHVVATFGINMFALCSLSQPLPLKLQGRN